MIIKEVIKSFQFYFKFMIKEITYNFRNSSLSRERTRFKYNLILFYLIHQKFITDPVFVPKVSVNGVTENSITIGWTLPPPDLKEHVHYYNLMATHAEQKREAMYPAQPFTVYAFVNLDPATTYKFKIAACSEYTKQCGNWSTEVNGTTLDGGKLAQKNIYFSCKIV